MLITLFNVLFIFKVNVILKPMYKKYILLICLKYINFINEFIKEGICIMFFYIHYTRKLDE